MKLIIHETDLIAVWSAFHMRKNTHHPIFTYSLSSTCMLKNACEYKYIVEYIHLAVAKSKSVLKAQSKLILQFS